MKILVTGGAGFIGSALVRKAILNGHCVVNIDSLTYAACTKNLEDLSNSEQYFFEKIDIRCSTAISEVLNKYKPDAIMNLAAESHVDRSIDEPSNFIQTNIVGTYNLLECSRNYWKRKGEDKNFRFLHVSTDEVFGSANNNELFKEDTSYMPNSPYAASKASSDHLVRAWYKTFNLPTLVTHCSNNYGPYQFPEKLIPKMISNIFNNKELPIYAKGKNSREWIHVKDHCEALFKLYLKGKVGESYNVGSGTNLRNIDLVKEIIKICRDMEIKIGNKTKIKFVKDRPGHDFRYALNNKKIYKYLKWKPKINFKVGLKETVIWYLNNKSFFKNISKKNYEKRLGLSI